MNRIVVMLLAVLFSSALLSAQIPEIQREAYLTGLSSPVFISNAGDGTNRMFVVQRRGLIKVVQPGSTTHTNFIDLSGVASQSGNERGLLGLAFHPDFENNRFFFVNYTRQSDGATVIERYKASPDGTSGDLNTAFEIIVIPQDFSNHNGGTVLFGPDNNLYIGMGDGGSGNDPFNRAQDINSLLGKMLRITPSLEEPGFGVTRYTNPSDNPYVGSPGRDEIFAIGLRNPYRFSFDRGGKNSLWAGDVGQNAIEEVSVVENSGNYGWRVYEGNSCTNLDSGSCTPSNYDPPVLEYSHSAGRCSITGGYVYRGTLGTFDQGDYIYADYCTGEYWIWDGLSQTLVENTPRNISGFGEDEAGELYIVDLNGTVDRIKRLREGIPNADFDGDGKTDVTVFRPDGGLWFSLQSSNGNVNISQFGSENDIPTPEDFDNDDRTDIAVFRPSEGAWYVFRSSDSTVDIASFGQAGDIPATGDFRGDGVVDLAVFRPDEGRWYYSDDFPDGAPVVNFLQFGAAGDVPVAGDYDSDGRTDVALYRPSEGVWYSTNIDGTGFRASKWGLETDVAAPGDFDGDGKTDLNVFRPDEGNWYTFLSATEGFRAIKWGVAGDIPVPGDYDGDGSSDTAIWRPNTGEWYVLRSSNFTFFAGPLGSPTDLPVPAYDRP